jgi:glycosyltransferase involved in cell wall biosynthesis
MKNEKLSGIILTHNNERTINLVLNSITNLVDELIIIDDYSSDQTLSIVKKNFPQAIILNRALNNDFAAQRNFALSKASFSWVLMIDSDEEVSPSLQKEIKTVLENSKFNAYLSTRYENVFNKWLKADSGRPILLKRELTFEGLVHENIRSEKCGFLKQGLYHHSWVDFSVYCEKFCKYAKQNAKDWVSKGYNFSSFYLVLKSIIYFKVNFFLYYFKYNNWRLGSTGILFSLISGTHYFFIALFYLEAKKNISIK